MFARRTEVRAATSSRATIDQLHGPMQQIMQTMGFSSFMYGVATGQTLHRDERFFIWTTVSSAWVLEYDRNSYIEIDPRVTYAWTTLSPPLIWDRRIGNGDAKVESFLE